VCADRLHEARQLGRGGDVGAQDPAGPECPRRGVEAVPGGEHVEDDPVRAFTGSGQLLGQVSQREPPGRVVAPEELGDITTCDVGELLTALERGHPAVGPDGSQERAGEGPRAHPGLDDHGTREDVGHGHDLGRVLRVDHGRSARHRDDELAEQRTEHQVLAAG
jgi:hypothetical protein